MHGVTGGRTITHTTANFGAAGLAPGQLLGLRCWSLVVLCPLGGRPVRLVLLFLGYARLSDRDGA